MSYWNVVGGIVGGGAAVVLAPVVLGAAGFTGAGIAASSVASYAMSVSGTVASGGMIATLQSAGAAGLCLSTKAILATGGGAVGSAVVKALT